MPINEIATVAREVTVRPEGHAVPATEPAVVTGAVSDVEPAQLVTLSGGQVMVTGTVRQISGRVARWRAEGRLLETSTPTPDTVPGRFTLVVRLLPRTAARRVRAAKAPFWTRGRLLAAAGVGTALLAAAVWVVTAALAWLAAHLAMVIGLMVLLTALAGPRICKTVVNVSVTHRH